MEKVAIVAGATGLIGKELVRLLLEHPDYERVIALVRSNTGHVHEKLYEHTVLFEKLEQEVGHLLKNADVFCAIGTTIKKAKSREQFRRVDLEYPLRLGELAKREGSRSYSLVSAMGANAQSRIFYNRVKGEVEMRLAGLELNALHLFRPSLLLGDREEFRLGEKLASILAKPLNFLFTGPLRKYRAIEARSVAKAMVKAVQSDVSGVYIYESDEIEKMSSGE